MILNDREKKIAIGVGILAVALIGWQYVVAPYRESYEKTRTAIDDARTKLDSTTRIISRQRTLTKVWSEIIKGGLKTDHDDAEAQALNAAREWAQDAGVVVTGLKPLGPTKEGKFEVINFHLTCTGTMRQIAKLTWALETAEIPVRVNDVQLTPHKEGSNDLGVTMSISTLSLLPDTDARAGAGRTTGGGRS